MNAEIDADENPRQGRRWARGWLKWFALGFFLSLIIGIVVVNGMPQLYRARVALLVGSSLVSPNLDVSSIEASAGLARMYADLARRPLILRAVAEELHLPQPPERLAAGLSAVARPDSQVVEIVAVDADPRAAQAIANTTAQVLVRQAPTANEGYQAEKAFAAQQLEEVQRSIDSLEGQLRNVETSLTWGPTPAAPAGADPEVTRLRALLDAQRATYAGLLSFYQGGMTNGLTVVEPATAAVPIAKPVAQTLALSVLAGMALTAGGLALRQGLDDTLRWRGLAQRTCLGLPILGAVGTVPAEWGSVFCRRDPLSAEAEALRDVLANIYLSGRHGESQTVLVTSPGRADGRSFLAANLAAVMAGTGAEVLLIDADLRRPALNNILGLKNERGLGEALVDGRSRTQTLLGRIVQPGGQAHLRFIAAGRQEAPSPLILTSPRLKEILRLAKQRFRLVIIDGPAEGLAPDAGILAALADVTILVVRSGWTREEEAWRSRQALARRPGVNLAGVVFNRVRGPALPAFSPAVLPAEVPQALRRPGGAAERRRPPERKSKARPPAAAAGAAAARKDARPLSKGPAPAAPAGVVAKARAGAPPATTPRRQPSPSATQAVREAPIR